MTLIPTPSVGSEARTTYADAARPFLTFILDLCKVIEIRALDVRPENGRGVPRTVAGYFDDLESAVQAAVDLTLNRAAPAVYVTLNAVDPACLARSSNKLKEYAKPVTSDEDIRRRKLLLIDIDVVRPSGTSASEAEVVFAFQKAQEVIEYLTTLGFPEPLLAHSGNGAHVLYCVDLPNDRDTLELIKTFLEELNQRFESPHSDTGTTEADQPAVKIDKVVANAARITKAYGTFVRKGENLPDRPHRQSQLIEPWPSPVLPVSRRTLEGAVELMGERCMPTPTARPNDLTLTSSGSSLSNVPRVSRSAYGRGRAFDIESYAASHDIEICYEKPWNQDCTILAIAECVFEPTHRDGEAGFIVWPSGVVSYTCFHTSCADKKLDDVVEQLGSPKPDQFPLDGNLSSSPSHVLIAPEEVSVYLPAHEWTDAGTARLLVDTFGDLIRYCHTWKAWLVWDGVSWNADETGAVMSLAKEIAAQIAQVAISSSDMSLLKFAVKTANLPRLNAMQSAAASDVPVRVEELDQDNWLLNCPNGTVDLKDGLLHPHNRLDFITRVCPTRFDIRARAPRFMKFLKEVFIDDDVILFVQRVMGYCLTGDVREQKMLIFWGDGANGKSTFINIMLHVLGPQYSMQAEHDMLVEGKQRGHSTDRMDLYQKRLVVASETESGQVMAQSYVKQLTGGDRIRGRRMQENNWEYSPTHKLILVTNHLPIVKNNDPAVWRRIILVPFTQQFDEAARDKALLDKLKDEAEGILAWAIRGCVLWRFSGLMPPPSVTAATHEYREDQDSIGRFLRECTVQAPHLKVRFPDLYRAYGVWCEANGEYISTNRYLSKELRKLGFEDYTDNGLMFRGLGLMSNLARPIPYIG